MNEFILVVVAGIVACAMFLWLRMIHQNRSWKGEVAEIWSREVGSGCSGTRKRHHVCLNLDNGKSRCLRFDHMKYHALFPEGLAVGDTVVKDAGSLGLRKQR